MIWMQTLQGSADEKYSTHTTQHLARWLAYRAVTTVYGGPHGTFNSICLLGVTLHPFVVIFIHFLWLCCCFVSICRHFASHTSKNAAINSRNGKNSLQRLWWPTRDIHMTRHKTLSLWAYYWLCAVHLVVKLHCMYLCSTLCTLTGRSVC